MDKEDKARAKYQKARGKAAKGKAAQELEASKNETQKWYTVLKINHDLEIAEQELAWKHEQKAKAKAKAKTVAKAEAKTVAKALQAEYKQQQKYGQLSFF